MTLWLTKHSAFTLERDCSILSLGFGWNLSQNILFFNFVSLRLMFMWNVRPGWCARGCFRPLNRRCGKLQSMIALLSLLSYVALVMFGLAAPALGAV